METDGKIKTLRAVIRRLRYVAPELKSVRGVDIPPEDLAAAAEAEGIEVREDSDAEIHCPIDGVFHPAVLSAPIVAVIARDIEGEPPAGLVEKRQAKQYIPLRDWVRGWFPEDSSVGKAASQVLVSPAVGDRLCQAPIDGFSEWIFAPGSTVTPRQESPTELIKYHLVTAGGIGMFPIMPATLASLVLVPIALVLYLILPTFLFFLFWLAVAGAATYGSYHLEAWSARYFLSDDPREFVLDEVAGMALAWAMLPWGAGAGAILVAFFLFRVFDIFKWGIHWVEELPVQGKIVWDDLLAGAYAGIATALLAILL